MAINPGARVRLIKTDDPYTTLKPGDEGDVTFVDDLGTVFVDWDNGSQLGLVRPNDMFVEIPCSKYCLTCKERFNV